MKIKEEFSKTQKAARGKVVDLMVAAFGLVAALAWNDAIQTIFNSYFPKGSGLAGKIIYAFFVTLLIVIITTQLQKLNNEDSK